jgi:hypothetical protein
MNESSTRPQRKSQHAGARPSVRDLSVFGRRDNGTVFLTPLIVYQLKTRRINEAHAGIRASGV